MAQMTIILDTHIPRFRIIAAMAVVEVLSIAAAIRIPINVEWWTNTLTAWVVRGVKVRVL